MKEGVLDLRGGVTTYEDGDGGIDIQCRRSIVPVKVDTQGVKGYARGEG